MIQENYKTLIYKLFGTILALVVMLAGATLLRDSLIQPISSSAYRVAQKDRDLLNKAFGITVESNVHEAELSPAATDLENIKLNMVADLSWAIENIRQQNTIPAAIKANLIEKLTREMANISDQMILPQSKSDNMIKCREDDVGRNKKVPGESFSWI